MSYDNSPIEEKYERCLKAAEILGANCKDPKTDMEQVRKALGICSAVGADDFTVSALRQAIIELNVHRGYGEFCPLEEVDHLFD